MSKYWAYDMVIPVIENFEASFSSSYMFHILCRLSENRKRRLIGTGATLYDTITRRWMLDCINDTSSMQLHCKIAIERSYLLS